MSTSVRLSGTRCLFAGASLLVGVAAANADVIVYTAVLDGPSEPTPSPGIGTSTVTLDTVAHTMRVQAQFSGLIGTTTASHIHAPTAVPLTGTAGVATQTPTFTGFPLGVTSGTYDHTFNMLDSASYNTSFIAANGGTAASAEVALFNAMAQGRSYLNIHSSAFPGGEIRGFLVPAPGGLAVLAAAGLCGFRRRRR